MKLTVAEKERIKSELRKLLLPDGKIDKIVLFGSFVQSEHPNDIDLAIYSKTDMDYLSLAMEYRKKIRSIADEIPVDVVPIKVPFEGELSFLQEVSKGEVIYEKRD